MRAAPDERRRNVEAPRRTLEVGRPASPRRRWPFVVVILLALLMLGLAFVSRPLRRELERRMNAELEGYTATIGSLVLHPHDLGIELIDVTMVQNAQPNPPVFYAPRWTTSLDWRALLHGRLVASVEFDHARSYVMRTQVETEVHDKVPVSEHGWQEAVEAVSPLKINTLRFVDAEVTYYDTGPLKPLRLHDLDFVAENIRNVRSARGRYPSPWRATATVFDRGRVRVHGDADFLAVPQAAVRADAALTGLDLGYLAPLATPFNVRMRGGVLDARGRADWAPWRKTVSIDDVTVSGAKMDYEHSAATADVEAQRARTVVRAATDVKARPPVRVDVEHARITKSTLAFVNQATSPPYRLFLDDADVAVRGFSNARDARDGAASLRGRFMGSGDTRIDATFRGGGGPDFSLDVQLADVDLPAMNDLLRAHGGFDVARGRFGFYSQLAVRDRRITGYVKPLFADVSVYDSKQDAEKSLGQKIYEGAVGGLATVLENRSRDEIATQTDLTGPIDDPQSSTLEIILRLLQNAFFKAILPGLDRARPPSR
jgi:hypothetical protein